MIEQLQRKAKVMVCVPSLGDWTDDMAYCLSLMLDFVAAHPFPGLSVKRSAVLAKKRGSLMPKTREEFFDDARANGCTHALCLDADQTFPKDTLHRLLMHNKPIVACNVATKASISMPTARAKDGTPYGTPIPFEGKTGLGPCWRVGLAVALVDLKAIEPMGRGLFEVRWSPEINQYIGEDWDFCSKAEKSGIEITIDHDLSKQIGHVGRKTFTHRDVPPMVESEQEAA